MATVAENLQTLNNAKQAIKTAIENKGQDLNGVPFTEYAEKIEAIESGSSADAEFIAGFINRTDMTNMFKGCTELKTIPYMDTSKVTYMDSMFQGCSKLVTIPQMDMSKVIRMTQMFRNCNNLTTVPYMDTSSNTDMSNTFNGCNKLLELPAFDTSNVTGFGYAFNGCFEFTTIPKLNLSKAVNMSNAFQSCTKLKTVPELDVRNVTNLNNMFYLCYELTTCLLKNIKVNFQVGSGTNWGTKLTQESALHLCKECIQDRDNAHTITFATPVYNNLETLYVRQITVTDEMRAEDDLIDKKRPFELCASTDTGAMTLANYMTLKGWSIAK